MAADLDEVTVVAGVPTGGSGTVPTLKPIGEKLDSLAIDIGNMATDIGTLATGNIEPGTATVPSADYLTVGGGVLHDGAFAGPPVPVGLKALGHGANPTAVTAADVSVWYANRAGVPWVIGGHPNIIARSCAITSAQSDAALVGTISTGTKYVITQLSVKAGSDVSGSLTVKIGFGASAVPTTAEGGVAGMIYEGEITQGQGQQIGNGAGIIAIGGDGEELRITSDDPGSAYLYVQFSYYTIES